MGYIRILLSRVIQNFEKLLTPMMSAVDSASDKYPGARPGVECRRASMLRTNSAPVCLTSLRAAMSMAAYLRRSGSSRCSSTDISERRIIDSKGCP